MLLKKIAFDDKSFSEKWKKEFKEKTRKLKIYKNGLIQLLYLLIKT